jgi:uncharacterized protein (DUF952 family)
MFIYHLVKVNHWAQFKELSEYESETFKEEKFIHASSERQLQATANRYFAGETSVILLTIDTNKLEPRLKWEKSPTLDEDFPHIFGAINLSAVVKTQTIDALADGSFAITA